MANEPKFPEGFHYLMEIFWQLFDSSGPITYQEIKAFMEIDGTTITAFEAEALRYMSDAARRKMNEMQEKS
ncbi:phage tail assembly chaperone [Escherichia coli]|uniref:phage tail assembly chaperone n=1 Tax=Escherichia coli TaxID=562 RepID=UPI003D9CB87B